MALTNCPECRHQVSDTALKCMHCGFQLRKIKHGLFGKLFLSLFIFFNLFAALWLYTAIGNAIDHAPDNQGDINGAILIFVFWALGDVILGALTLLTKPKG